MNNIVFDFCACITTEKSFDELTVEEFVAAARERLNRIEEDSEIGSFGFVDEYDEKI